MQNLPKTREQYLEAIKAAQIDEQGEHRVAALLGLLIEAVVDLKEETAIPFEPEYGAELKEEVEF